MLESQKKRGSVMENQLGLLEFEFKVTILFTIMKLIPRQFKHFSNYAQL